MIVSAIVVSHGHARELETLVPLLEPQVDEVVVVANTPGLDAVRPSRRASGCSRTPARSGSR